MLPRGGGLLFRGALDPFGRHGSSLGHITSQAVSSSCDGGGKNRFVTGGKEEA